MIVRAALVLSGFLSASVSLAAQQVEPKPVVPAPSAAPATAPAPRTTPAAAPAGTSPKGAASSAEAAPGSQAVAPDAAPNSGAGTGQAPGTGTAPTSPAGVQSAAGPDATDSVPVAGANVDPNYVLGTDDQIMVNVWKEPTLTGGLIIRPDGRISMPLIGDVVATGLTPMALAKNITERLKKFINDPTVTVTVANAFSKRIFFIGEVQHPGPLALTREMTMLQAISAAGGLTPYANGKKIYILRGDQGKQQKIPYNYKKALHDGNQQNVLLLAGDTIVVP